jgi:hypothetical protein
MKAVADGLLDPAGEYIAHRRAGLYRCSETLTKNQLLTSGLVSIVPPSECSNSSLVSRECSPLVSIVRSEQSSPLVSTPRERAENIRTLPCRVHRKDTPHWLRGEDWVCDLCHPDPESLNHARASAAGAVAPKSQASGFSFHDVKENSGVSPYGY